MIKGLKAKVFWILMIPISVILIGIIVLFAVLNYNNTINSATFMMDRFNDVPKIPNIDQGEIFFLNDNKVSIDLSNTYIVMFENGKVLQNSAEKKSVERKSEESNLEIKEIATKAYKKNSKKGIINEYIYKVRETKDGKVMVVLLKDESVTSHIRFIFIITACGIIVLISITYIISKKISEMIVRPVEETIEQQKRFISDSSHELKTPLAVIEANVDVLESQVGKSKWMEYIQSEISSMNKLINDLLCLAKVEGRSELVVKEQFNLSDEIKMIKSIFESLAFEKQLKFDEKIQENINFNGNKEDIKQILSVLIENAIMHTNSQGQVIVELEKEKGNIIIQVKNQGEEITEEEREKIFERFYRVDKSRNRKNKRFGLGLSIAKSIVEQYNGKIQVECKNDFTIFKVIL